MAAFKLPESIKEGVILRALNHPMSLVDCDWRPLMSVVNRVNLRIFLSLTPAFELVGMGQVTNRLEQLCWFNWSEEIASRGRGACLPA